EIGESSETGAATVILSGISVGLESAVYSALLIGGAVYLAFLLGTGNASIALFAVALAGTGLFGAFRSQVTAELLVKHLAGFSLGIDAPNDLFGLIIGASVVFFF